MKRISAIDASFFYADTKRTPSVIGGLTIYDQSTAKHKKVRFKEILHWIEERLDYWAPFRQRLVRVPFDLGLPYLTQDPHFDVEFHVHHLALPKPGDWRQLCILASRLYARPMDMNRPLWELYVIEGLDKVEGLPKGGFAILMKLHHIVADGKSTMILMNLLNTRDLSQFGTPPPRKTGLSLPSDTRLLARSVPDLMLQPVSSLKSATELVKGEIRARKLKEEKNLASAPSAPASHFNKKLSPYRVFDACSFSLSGFRAIKKSVKGATINDVAIAVAAGGLRQYLSSRQKLPEKSLVAMCPISVRGEGNAESGNYISDMTVAMGTDIEDPLQRLQAIKMRTDDAKEIANIRGPGFLGHMMGLFSPAAASVFFKSVEGMKWVNRIKPVCNTFVSNVPGFQTDVFLCGARMDSFYGMAPLGDGMGIFHAFTSYKDRLFLSVTACRDLLPDPAFYIECIQDAARELEKAAGCSEDHKESKKENKNEDEEVIVYLKSQ